VLSRVAAWISAAFGAFLLGRQVIEYLKWGTWVSLPATDIFLGPRTAGASSILGKAGVIRPLPASGFGGWLSQPQGWIGIQKFTYGVLHILSIPFVLALFAFFFWRLSGSIDLSLTSGMSFPHFRKKPRNGSAA